MITTDGKVYIKRYLAQLVPSIAQSIAFGSGDAAESGTHTKLSFEVGRSDIVLTSYDFVNNKLIFKAPVPEDFGGKIYEVALFSTPANAAAGEWGSKIITTFDSDTETWADASTAVAGTFNTTNARIGTDALRHAPATGVTKIDTLTDVSLDLSGYSGADKFVLSFNAGNAFASAVRIRFLTDASNYYDVNFGAATAGYKIVEVAKSAATATGTPNWENITEIRAVTTASGGTAQIDFDGLRIEDLDTINPDYVMISRELLAAPFTKVEGMTQEIEFTMDVNV